METSPLVSFCMSTYKRPVMLREQLQRILQQKYDHFEIFISDNDTEESGRVIAEGFADPRIRYFANGSNIGMVESFNNSIWKSTGEYIVMIADDDPVYPDMIEVLMDARDKHPGYGVYAGCGDWIVETEDAARSLNEKVGTKSTLLADHAPGSIIVTEGNEFPVKYLNGLFRHTFLLWNCCMVERKVISTVKGMPNYGSELLTDHAFLLAIGSQNGLVFINKALGGQSVRGDNFGYNFDALKEKYLHTPVQFFNYLQPYFQGFENWPEIRKCLWNFIGRGWVDYSLMLYRTIRTNKGSKRTFFSYFNKVFANPDMRKWKYKFYLKAYAMGLFKALLFIKKRVSK